MKKSGFNPKARWDRHIPETGQESNIQELDEKIDVLARFDSGKIAPCNFYWKNKEYSIKKVNYSWQERLGQEIISHFSVDTGTNLYQISFNNTSLGWRIDKIIA
jgi:hypothetical protein